MTQIQYNRFINNVDVSIKFDIANHCGNDACPNWMDKALCFRCMEAGRCIEINANFNALCKLYSLDPKTGKKINVVEA